ncbi:MAG: hypothetical protein KJO07_21285, partial [Deltaproteobacteria bacterium]|nr:hypothetical protein [Deltaproteobacteria bacterium]
MDNTRKFLDRVLSSGMECGVVTPEGILRQVTPAMLALNLPKPLLASLIKAGLKNKSFDADLIVEVLGVRAIASYMPI